MRFIPVIVSALIVLCGCIIYFSAKKKPLSESSRSFWSPARMRKAGIIISVLGLWLLIGCVITLIFGKPVQEEFAVYIIPQRVNFTIFGYQPSETMVVSWGVMAVLIAGAAVIRIFFIPKINDIPGKFQNIVEILVETVENYTSERTVYLGRPMFGFIFSICIMLIGNLAADLMGFRSPSSDLMFTAALSISAFFMANWYGIRRLSVKGRLKNMANPSPILMPIRLLTDLVNPLSMACRLFGNTISGMIVINLIYSALGNFAAGIPSVVGLYFSVFSALIQMIIFITLTLSNINEATAEPAA